ncbi:hypothetical protein BDW66DRAFT_133540 [Aspergillus desertorum]
MCFQLSGIPNEYLEMREARRKRTLKQCHLKASSVTYSLFCFGTPIIVSNRRVYMFGASYDCRICRLQVHPSHSAFETYTHKAQICMIR